jgi:hypothetical protein
MFGKSVGTSLILYAQLNFHETVHNFVIECEEHSRKIVGL